MTKESNGKNGKIDLGAAKKYVTIVLHSCIIYAIK